MYKEIRKGCYMCSLRLKKWIIFCKRKDLDDLFKVKDSNYFYNNYVICSDHFKVECFRNKNLLSQGLLPNSNPTLRPNVTSKVQKRKNHDDEIASNCVLSPKRMRENKENKAPMPDDPDQQNEIAALKKLLNQYKKKLINKNSLLSKYKNRCKQLKNTLALRENER
ncbi:uncharacterized protein LOC125225631 isoform X2 [Leguminivora glycinivorella]|uniref:uncharacterized protein LOC125225631 isoform X2 n=1 Tax=Leguminivora glycinivorella TaxID=1035111 RepID=UPI00200CB3CA|nr:uncharacterized protein LOC125225631 isoform X2 [Leguminivora glycinivorella]